MGNEFVRHRMSRERRMRGLGTLCPKENTAVQHLFLLGHEQLD